MQSSRITGGNSSCLGKEEKKQTKKTKTIQLIAEDETVNENRIWFSLQSVFLTLAPGYSHF